MPGFRRAAAATVAVALLPSAVLACAWDYDTLQMERQRFPTALELITGKFLRHSKEFYEWRIRDRQARLAADPGNLALLDDLGVAFDKTGQHEKAIETMRTADKLRPDRYETHANLGTFLIHSGRLEEGLPHIDAAIRINPDAHFGREKYQKYLVEYVLRHRKDGKITLPLTEVVAHGPAPEDRNPGAESLTVGETFAKFLEVRNQQELGWPAREAAIKGVLGMLKFGHHDSPVLLEALGSLLADDTAASFADAKRLSARAYLKASYEVKDEAAQRDYRRLAAHALSMQTVHPGTMRIVRLEQIEAEFQKELAEAREWYAELREKELSWIRDGKNPDEEFDKLYDQEPEVTWAREPWHLHYPFEHVLAVLCVGLLLAFGILFFIRRSRHRAA